MSLREVLPLARGCTATKRPGHHTQSREAASLLSRDGTGFAITHSGIQSHLCLLLTHWAAQGKTPASLNLSVRTWQVGWRQSTNRSSPGWFTEAQPKDTKAF